MSISITRASAIRVHQSDKLALIGMDSSALVRLLQVLTVTPNHIMYRAPADMVNSTVGKFAMRQAISAGDLKVRYCSCSLNIAYSIV